jgi:hypothetical protein
MGGSFFWKFWKFLAHHKIFIEHAKFLEDMMIDPSNDNINTNILGIEK